MTMFPPPGGAGGKDHRGPEDRNRRRRVVRREPGQWPDSLRYGYYLAMVAAVVLLALAMVIWSQAGTVTGNSPEVDADAISALEGNQKFIAGINAVTGLFIAGSAAQLKSGSRNSRRVLAAVAAVALFNNVAGFAFGAVGWWVLVPVGILAAMSMLVFRSEANDFIAEMSPKHR